MQGDRVRGKTIRWTFTSGPMGNRTFEHRFEDDGSVTWCALDGDTKGKKSRASRSEVARVGEDVYAVSYLGDSGYTLTVVLDVRSGRMVGFASNEKELSVHPGTFEFEESGKVRSKAASNRDIPRKEYRP